MTYAGAGLVDRASGAFGPGPDGGTLGGVGPRPGRNDSLGASTRLAALTQGGPMADGGLLSARAAGAAAPQPALFQSAVTNVYDAFCAQQAGGLSYCETLGRCVDPLLQQCRQPGYAEPEGLPACVRGAQARCAAQYAGDARTACARGTEQAMRAPNLVTTTAQKSLILYPEPFAWGAALAQNLCSSVG